MKLSGWWPFSLFNKTSKKQEDETYSSLVRVYTPVRDLAIGMYVADLDSPWLESPFLFQGFELKTEADIEAVREVCAYVYIDTTKTKTRAKTEPTKIVHLPSSIDLPNVIGAAPPPRKISEFKQEIGRAETIYHSTGLLVSGFMDKIAKGGSVDSELAKQAVAQCVDSVLHSPDAMLWLSQLKHKDEYTSQHSLNVCVLSIVLARQLNFSDTHLNIIGLCGLMHDMGKMLVPLEILNKPGSLEPEEQEIMRSHATLGYELLKSSEGIHPNAVMAAYCHHEQLNGKGYPRKLKEPQLSLATRIVSIADMYDAITSDRVYQKGRTHLEATHVLANLAGSQLDQVLVFKFIESLGVYPPGCLVELTNGAIAIVVEVNDAFKLRPKIIIIVDEDKCPAEEQVLDLAEMIKDKRGNVYTIRGIVKAQDWNIDASKYYQQGILQKGFARSSSA